VPSADLLKIRIFKVVVVDQDDLEKFLRQLGGVLIPVHSFSAPKVFENILQNIFLKNFTAP